MLNVDGRYPFHYLITSNDCDSDSASVTIEVMSHCTFGTDELFDIENVAVFPNPSNELFNITFKASNTPNSYSITDLAGRDVKSGKITYK